MKKLLIILTALLLAPVAYATIGLQPSYTLNSFLTGNTTSIITSTTTPYFPLFNFGSATGTSATTTNFFATNASTTNLFGTLINGFNLTACTGTNALTWSSGVFSCTAQPQGTVTAIGVTTANGVSGSSSGGATPNLTITLGAITPSSVVSAGLGHFANLWSDGSSTLQNFTFLNATGSQATTTSLFSTRADFTTLCISQDCKTAWPASGTGGNSKFSTSTNLVAIYPNGGTNIAVVIGGTATTGSNMLEVNGFIDTDKYSGYKQDNLLLGYASSTNQNTIWGFFAGGQNATTSATLGYNNAFGAYALSANTTGTANTGNGVNALTLNKTGSANTAIGFDSLYHVTASDNTGFGDQAGYNITSGYGNIYIGEDNGSGGSHLTTGFNNIYFGYNAVGTSSASTNFLNIANSLFGTIVATSSSNALPTLMTGISFGIATSTLSGNTFSIQNAVSTNNLARLFNSLGTPVFTIDNGGNVVMANATATNATTTNFFATTASSTNLFTSSLGIATGSPWTLLTLASSSLLVVENKVATSTSQTLDWNQSNSQLMQIGTSAITVTMTRYLAGQHLLVVVCNPGSGTAGTITWSGVEWAGGTQPTQTTTAKQCDTWSFIATQATSTTGGLKVFGTAATGFQ